MNKSIIPTLQKTFGDRAISHEDKQAFEQEHGCEWQEDWSEYDEGEVCDYLTPEILEYQNRLKRSMKPLVWENWRNVLSTS
jgi:hypothetical protein